ncbi:peptidoglycan-binding protein [Streptomyces sp. NBC_01007]|nr:peptidoglycan-binding protein [Streptomyces sp. NBC_01007]
MRIDKLATAAITTLVLGSGLALAPSASAGAAAPTAQTARTAPGIGTATSHECTYNGSIGWHCNYYNKKWQSAAYTSSGDHNDRVKEIQKLINDTTAWKHGHTKLAIDGKFGSKTLKAVKWFQYNYMGHNQNDGKVGRKTWKALRF